MIPADVEVDRSPEFLGEMGRLTRRSKPPGDDCCCPLSCRPSMRNFTLAVLLLGLAVPVPAARKGWTPARRKLQTRACIEAYWDVHPDVTQTPAYSRQVVDYCACVTDELSDRVDYAALGGREVLAVIVDVCRTRVGLK